MHDDLLSNERLQQIYADPWMIRRLGTGTDAFPGRTLETPADWDQLYLDYYQQRTGLPGERLLPHQGRANMAAETAVPRLSVSFPEFTCLTDAAPAAHALRASRSFNAPAVQLITLKGEAAVSLNFDIPMVGQTVDGQFTVVEEVSSPYYPTLNIRGGKSIFESNQIQLDSIYFFNDHFGANNFAHWLLDWIPRLKFLVEHPDLQQSSIIFGMPMSRIQRDTLRILKIDSNRIIQVRKNTLKIPVNFVTSHLVGCGICGKNLRRPAQICSPWALDFIQNTFLKPDHTSKRKKIIINRRGTRKLLLSSYMKESLIHQGFEEFFLENMDIEDQARLFNQADIIISAHGAGLSNLVFCRAKTKVLEVFPENYSTANFFSLSAAMELDYVCAVGISRKSPLGNHLRDYDVEVDDRIISRFLSG